MLIRRRTQVPSVIDGEGIRRRVVIGPDQGAPTFAIRVVDLAARASTHNHNHDWEHGVLILRGRGLLLADTETHRIGAGDAIYIAPGEQHCFQNPYRRVLTFVCVVPLRGESR